MRLHLVRRQDLAHRSLSQFRQARMTDLRPVISRMRRQQTGRPQFVWIPKRDRLRAGKRDKPRPSFRCNHRVASRPCTVVERRQHPQFRGSLQAPCHGLWAHSGPARDGVSRWLIQVSKDNPGPLHTARRLGPRTGNIDQRPALVRINRQRNNAACSNHRLPHAIPPYSIPHLAQAT